MIEVVEVSHRTEKARLSHQFGIKSLKEQMLNRLDTLKSEGYTTEACVVDVKDGVVWHVFYMFKEDVEMSDE
jgi:hypothetical protein